MRIAVTGAGGFIGRELVKSLLNSGHTVTILARSGVPEYLNSSVTVVRGDLTDQNANLQSLVENCDVLCHCAAELYRPELMEELHVGGTRRLLAEVERHSIARDVPVHWINLSSVGTYGPPKRGANEERVITEGTAPCPVGPYEITKTKADDLVLAASERGTIQHTILRPTNVFGESMTNRSLYGLLSAIRRRIFFYIGQAGAIANYVHVDDVVASLVASATQPAARNKIFNVSNDCRLEELVANSAKELGVSEPGLRVPESTARLIARLGSIVPRFPLTQGRVDALVNRTTYVSVRLRSELNVHPSVTVASRACAMLQMETTRNTT
ncbi:NAD-dependent epimerase/dehydratase domain-containing protein [Cupriavidus sp. H19C3]|uniref:NAD-dependent epimerase/dehydratase family protein n=1 Tax=Cupriavidus sp. H19C3 TaxID=3241603 RepID=UPI003BF7D735